MEKIIRVLSRVFTVLYFLYTIGMLLAFVAGGIVNMTKKKEEKKEKEESLEEQSAKLREELEETERELKKVKERRDEDDGVAAVGKDHEQDEADEDHGEFHATSPFIRS